MERGGHGGEREGGGRGGGWGAGQGSPRAWNFFPSHSCMINLAPSVSESSELSDNTGGGKSGESRLRELIG